MMAQNRSYPISTFRNEGIRSRLATIALGAMMLFFCAANSYAGPIYVVKQRDGSLRFTSKTPAAGETYQEFTAKHGSVSWIRGGHGYQGKLFPNVYESEILNAAQMHQVSAHLIRAVIHAESGFNPRAVSPKGARGLMQLMPATAQELGVKNSFDPHQNVLGGTRYLAELMQRYAGNVRKALAAYNAGPGAVDSYRGVPPFSETIAYIDRVLNLSRRYSARAGS